MQPLDLFTLGCFFPLINARHEHASTVLTSNTGFAECGTVLGDEVDLRQVLDAVSRTGGPIQTLDRPARRAHVSDDSSASEGVYVRSTRWGPAMRLQDICEYIMEDVDGALGCALVDLGTGLPLAMRVASDALIDNVAMEILSAAGAEYFRGDVNHQLESALGGASGDRGFVQEIQTTTEDTYHFMSVIPGKEQTILMLVTDRTANLGLGWVAMRRTLARVQEMSSRGSRPASDTQPAPDPQTSGLAEITTPMPNGRSGNAARWKTRRGLRGR